MLRGQGVSWVTIANKLGVGEGTVRRAGQASAKNPSSSVAVSPCEIRAALARISTRQQHLFFAASCGRTTLDAHTSNP
jgi:hypothetical protein